MDATSTTRPDLDRLPWRALSLADVPAVTRLLAAAERVDRTGEHNSEDDVAEWLTSPGLDLARDSFGAVGPDGDLLAAGLAFATQTVVRTEHRIDLDGVVHPQARRRGLGTRLLRRQEERAAELHRERHPEVPGQAALVTVDHVESKLALAAANGYRPIRWWNEMRREVTGPLPEVPPVPAGLRLERFDPRRDDAVRRAHNEAFAEHFGSSERSPEFWRHWLTGAQAFRPDLSLLVLDRDEVAGYLLSYLYAADTEASGAAEGWVGQLGVRPRWRRRGLGTLLLASALAAYREAGLDRAGLGVDTGNVTGALGLYERLGFTVANRSVVSVKPL